jgi:hypothetical protein
METLLLRDQNVPPEKEVLADALGKSYKVFKELMEIITDTKYGLDPQWNFYKDGKAWFCKVCFKKKTIFWLSVWENFFKTAFYFTEKSGSGIKELDIDENIKEDFAHRKHIGKLIPLVINMDRKEQIKDLIRIIEYKKSLK